MIIPDTFELKDKILSGSGINMKLKANGKKIGQIKKTDILTGRQYELINTHNELIAIARKYVTDHGDVLEIFDELNNKVGSIQRLIYVSPSRSQKYVIRNVFGEVVAETPQLDSIRHSVDLFDNMKVKVGEMREGTGLLSSGWKIHLFGNFDRRLLTFVPFFVQNEPSIKTII